MAEAATSKAISKIIEQGIFLYGVDEQVTELVTELQRMRCFLKDVESRKQHEERVTNWAEEIRKLAQDAECVVDKYAAEVNHVRGEDVACFCTMLARAFKEVVARYKIGWDIGKINKRIKSLTESLTTYGILGINEGETTSITQVILQSKAIAVERWGGPGGSHWSYWPNKGLLKQIVVKHGVFVDSLTFTSIDENGIMEPSQTFGGSGGSNLNKIDIDCPSEYLRGISGTFGYWGSHKIVKSIMFYTNLSHHGPYGLVNETDTSFSFLMQGGVVVGFHGSSGILIDAIGLYVMPARFSLT